MAVGFIMEFTGIGEEKYHAVMKELGIPVGSNANWPDGILTHVVGKTSTGMVVVDTWESDQHFGRFMETRLKPAFGKVSGMPEPKVTQFQVLNRFPK